MAASIVSGKISLKASQAVRGQKTLESWTNISIFHFHAENKYTIDTRLWQIKVLKISKYIN